MVNNKPIRAVSLDLSKTRTGIAYWLDGKLTGVDDISFSEYKYFGEVLHNFKCWCDDWIAKVDLVAYEEIFPRNKFHSELHFGFVGSLASRLFVKQVPLIGITSGAVKKRLTGNGRASKDEMLAAARELYPELDIDNHDQSDAIAVGLSAIDKMVVQEPVAT